MAPSARAPQGNGVRSHDDWVVQVNQKIHEEAQKACQYIPPYFRRIDAFGNPRHPSIFSPRPKANRHAVASPPHAAGQPSATETTDDDQVVVAAVGPYHRCSATAQPQPLITYANKCGIVRYLTRFNLDVEGFLKWAKDKEGPARLCYERDSFQMSSQEFAEMLLLDGCLLLFAVFLIRPSIREDKLPAKLARDEEHGKEFRDLSADISFHMQQTRLDLLLLHNQIPFFVLTELHRRLKDTFFAGITRSFEQLALSCFQDVHPFGLKEGEMSPTPMATANGNAGWFPPTVHHLLHLFHWSLVPRDKHAVDTDSIPPREPESHLPSATELEESFTVFTKQKKNDAMGSSSSCCFDITFESSKLHTGGSHLRCGHGVTAYAICMARLLQIDADARLLRNSGILPYTQRTDKEIVDMFRLLVDDCRNTCVPNDLLKLCNDVAAHHQSTGVRVLKGFVMQCFPRQTVTFFVIFAAIISFATLINTVHSMYRYYHPLGHLSPLGR
ncbi:uncharacterized protein LOC107304877 [Oryza brachyantha]|uniref:uncharacterized protein LOC107304877 n=1 Tax=Oryza brachyantha TaxID=4533 RepID=UPI0007769DC9|nr:uncharacterized protein LOC107304877 [Oryza brachyantha]